MWGSSVWSGSVEWSGTDFICHHMLLHWALYAVSVGGCNTATTENDSKQLRPKVRTVYCMCVYLCQCSTAAVALRWSCVRS